MARLLLPAALLLAALGLYLVLRVESGPVDVAATSERARPGTPAPGSIELRGPAPSPEAEKPVGPPTPVSVDPRTLPKGALEVAVAGPDDVALAVEGITVHLEPGPGSKEWTATPLLLADGALGSWSCAEVPAGPVRVRVTGDHVLETVLDTRVEAGAANSVRVQVDLGGALTYDAKLFSGEAPEQVTLTLLDARRQPVRARYQVRTQRVLTQPRSATVMTQGPQGVVFGIPPGRYTLRAVSSAEESDESEVEITPGVTVAVSLRIRR